MSALDIGHAEASVYIDETGYSVGAFASAYSPGFSFDVGELTFSMNLEIGAVGAKIGKDGNKHSIKGAYLVGGNCVLGKIVLL